MPPLHQAPHSGSCKDWNSGLPALYPKLSYSGDASAAPIGHQGWAFSERLPEPPERRPRWEASSSWRVGSTWMVPDGIGAGRCIFLAALADQPRTPPRPSGGVFGQGLVP